MKEKFENRLRGLAMAALLAIQFASAGSAEAQSVPGFLPRLSCLVSCSQQYMTCMAPAVASFSWCLPFSLAGESFDSCALHYDHERLACTRENNPCLRNCEPRRSDRLGMMRR